METPKFSLTERLLIMWKYEWKYIPHNIINGIKNLYKWFPVIWKDKDWDDSFLFEVMKFKISKMIESHGRSMPYVGYERNIEIMNTVVRLIDKVVQHEYLHEYHDYVDNEYNFVKVEGTDYYNMESTNLRDDLDDYFAEFPLVKKLAEQDSVYQKSPDRETLGIVMSKIRHDKAKKLLFDLMNRHIENWWE